MHALVDLPPHSTRSSIGLDVVAPDPAYDDGMAPPLPLPDANAALIAASEEREREESEARVKTPVEAVTATSEPCAGNEQRPDAADARGEITIVTADTPPADSAKAGQAAKQLQLAKLQLELAKLRQSQSPKGTPASGSGGHASPPPISAEGGASQSATVSRSQPESFPEASAADYGRASPGPQVMEAAATPPPVMVNEATPPAGEQGRELSEAALTAAAKKPLRTQPQPKDSPHNEEVVAPPMASETTLSAAGASGKPQDPAAISARQDKVQASGASSPSRPLRPDNSWIVKQPTRASPSYAPPQSPSKLRATSLSGGNGGEGNPLSKQSSGLSTDSNAKLRSSIKRGPSNIGLSVRYPSRQRVSFVSTEISEEQAAAGSETATAPSIAKQSSLRGTAYVSFKPSEGVVKRKVSSAPTPKALALRASFNVEERLREGMPDEFGSRSPAAMRLLESEGDGKSNEGDSSDGGGTSSPKRKVRGEETGGAKRGMDCCDFGPPAHLLYFPVQLNFYHSTCSLSPPPPLSR